MNDATCDTNQCAAAVRDFYEHHPYPPPVDHLDGYRERWADPLNRRADFHLLWPHHSYRENLSILIAGCGTAQAARYALRWPRAEVIGIDVSACSVRNSERLKRRYRLDNLQLHQLPIEQVGDLEQRFDQIVCTGVLHHLADPDTGLTALRDVLKPEGAMHLMVYAPYGRAGIYLLQEFCRRLQIPATAAGIRELIAALKALPPAHPLVNLLREAPDFRSEAALADALLHPQDRAYSVPQLFDFLQRGGLRFGRWLKQAAYSPHCGAPAQIPSLSRIIRLPVTEQYAAIELFRGSMLRHSLIAYRNDTGSDTSRDNSRPLTFANAIWPNVIPIRRPDTICVQERLPAGADAVLINRSHTYTDLYLPISRAEKCLFDAIDGKRDIRALIETVRNTPSSIMPPEAVRDFFERLWWYDQIVFDASFHGGEKP